MFKDYYQVRDWLESFIPLVYSKENLGLERIEYLLRLLGNPQNKFKSIHIAGTSGKGSTAYYVAKLLQLSVLGFHPSTSLRPSALRLRLEEMTLSSSKGQLLDSSQSVSQLTRSIDSGQAGKLKTDKPKSVFRQKTGRNRQRKTDNWKIGLHLSPHLVDIRERMQIFSSHVILSDSEGSKERDSSSSTQNDKNGVSLMPMGRFLRLFNEIRSVVESMRGSGVGLPSYFEILVAASFKYFAQEKVDWAVVEVGLGGRFDATNVLAPEVCVITNVGLDHTEILGKTIEKIAYEKAGIIKERTSVVTGAIDRALSVIEKVANEKKAPLIKVDTQLGVRPLKSDTKDNLLNDYDILRHIPGNFVFSNALLAMETVRYLGLQLDKSAIMAAISSGLPGRFEKIDEGVIIDGAHNPDKIRELLDFVKNSKLQIPNPKNILRAKREVTISHMSFPRKRESRDRILNQVENDSEGSRQARTLRQIVLVVAFKKGKDWKKMVDLLVKNLPIKKVVATEFQAVTDTGKFGVVSAQEVAAYVKSLRQGVSLTGVYSNSQEAVFEVLNAAYSSRDPAKPESREVNGKFSTGSNNNLVLVTGSLYLVGEVRTMWQLPSF